MLKNFLLNCIRKRFVEDSSKNWCQSKWNTCKRIDETYKNGSFFWGGNLWENQIQGLPLSNINPQGGVKFSKSGGKIYSQCGGNYPLEAALFFRRRQFFSQIFFQKNELQMAIVALKMHFRQKFWHRWKALGISFLKQRGHFGWKRGGFELWPADGGSVNSPFPNVYIRILAT